MKQYCRYCAYCFDAGEFRCSNHPNGKQVYMTRADINRANKCPNYQYSDLGDVETGKQYHPLKGKRKDKRKEKHIMQESLFERKEEEGETETWHSLKGNIKAPKGTFDKIYEDDEL